MSETKKTASRPDQMRISLVFHLDDPLEKAAYDILMAKSVKKSRSHLVSQAVLGFMYLDDKSNLNTYSIKSLVNESAEKVAASIYDKLLSDLLSEIKESGLAVAAPASKETASTKLTPTFTFDEPKAEKPKDSEEVYSERQSAAIEDMLSIFNPY